LTGDKKYDRYIRGLKTHVQGKSESEIQDREEAMLIVERYDAILFSSEGRGTGKLDVDIRVHHPVVPRKRADAVDVAPITSSQEARRVKSTDAE